MSCVMENLVARAYRQRPAQTPFWCFRRINQHLQAEIFKLIQVSMNSNLVDGKKLKITDKPAHATKVEKAVADLSPQYEHDAFWPIEVGYCTDESTS